MFLTQVTLLSSRKFIYYMGYSYMRMIVFFDLPVLTKKERKIYSRFRKSLIQKGFYMLQYSVYVKIYANRDAAELEKKMIKRISPEEGNIRIMVVTEKQYSKMEIIVGGLSNQEKTITEEAVLIL